MSEEDIKKAQGTGIDPGSSPEQLGDDRALDGGGEGVPEIRGEAGQPAENPGIDPGTESSKQGSGNPSGGAGRNEEGDGNPEIARGEVSLRRVVTDDDIGVAMKAAKGSYDLAAAALGLNSRYLLQRIDRTPALRALWGARKQGSKVEPPGLRESMLRSPQDIPEIPEAVDLAEVVSQSDNAILLDKLKEIGLSDDTLKKLKVLDGLAESTGKFLSISLEKTHRMYFFQLVTLMEVAETLRTEQLADPKVQGETRAFFLKVYTEMVKESGRGYNNMMVGAQAMMKMIMAANGNGGGDSNGIKAKPGWSRRKLDKGRK